MVSLANSIAEATRSNVCSVTVIAVVCREKVATVVQRHNFSPSSTPLIVLHMMSPACTRSRRTEAPRIARAACRPGAWRLNGHCGDDSEVVKVGFMMMIM
jgi:hypothetical protein